MRAFITASFTDEGLEQLRRRMEVVHEDWKLVKGFPYFDGEEFARKLQEVGADVLIVEADLVHAAVLDTCDLKLIGCCRGDPVNIDLDLCTAKGIPVLHTPGRNADAVADMTLMFILMLLRHMPAIHETYHGGAEQAGTAVDYVKMYKRFMGRELSGLTVGLVALGAVGREVAARLAGFRSKIIAYDPFVKTPPPGVTMVDLDTLMRESDVVSLHAPVLPETMNLVSREKLALMKPTALFINTARTALTDEDALYDMLKAGKIAGAGLDVLVQEPLQPGERFLELPNVVLTPHIGGATLDVTRHQSEIIVDSFERHLSGQRPRWVANPAVYDRKA